ncbi:nSTAND3 domain-containing NTPase [Bradyrhizobium glycinis]|uniref:nSTAND3 domain-containing NTPase n=1 Tax=Bradyrhizobium glycinis TaxID=2751812 RepID=UPI0018D83B6E|nr:hypothetical protein [Bradyrhizobium glycinis]MBH5373370.1 hypothetical protein [Bradyrhizobium glycinis]
MNDDRNSIEPQFGPAKVQASQPNYELHSLGWKAFQQLCVAIASEVWGQTAQGFYDSHDGGRDGAFHGQWETRSGEIFSGSFTAQCKFTSQPSKVLRLSDLKDEVSKIERLAERGLAQNYFLFTNARLTGDFEEKLRQVILEIPGVKHFAAYGNDRISQFIHESARLRMLVPRIYGLGDLSQILDERAYAQSQEILSAIGDDLSKFVLTSAYRKAARAIIEHGFVLLLGEPMCGKSTIAAALALGALDEWGCSTIKVRDADEFVRHSNPHEKQQFFWVDDAFGATQLDVAATFKWNSAFPHLHAAIRRGARVIFTSRDYIYRNARSFIKEAALPEILESQVVIKVQELSRPEKDQILYNHIRLGNQPRAFKAELKPHLPAVSAHPGFTPEIARRLGNRAFTKKLLIYRAALEDFVARPMQLLTDVIQTLDVSSRAAIALVFMRGGQLTSPISMTPDETGALELLGGSQAEVRNALNALNGSLLIQVKSAGALAWSFKHPTIRDAFATLVAENRELLDIYLTGTPVPRLMHEVSCGDVGYEGAKVIVPSDRFSLVLSRVLAFKRQRSENRDQVNRFLAYRCDAQFLKQYLDAEPDFLQSLHMWSYLDTISEIGVVCRLRTHSLLPEEDRKRHVAKICELAVDTPDSGFLDEEVRALFTADEFEECLVNVRSNLLLKLDNCISNWRLNCGSEDDPEEYFSTLETTLKNFKKEFAVDEDVEAAIDSGLQDIQSIVEDLQSDRPAPRRSSNTMASIEDSWEGSRSVFDDVDE